EPLRRGPKDHWVLTAPAMRVAVLVILRKQKHAAIAHKVNDVWICFEHALPCKVFHFRSEPSRTIHRTIDLQAITLADYKVIMTVTRRSMDAACARFVCSWLLPCFFHIKLGFGVGFTTERYVFSNHQQRRSIKPCVSAFKPIEFRARETGEHFWRNRITTAVAYTEITLCGNRFEQLAGDDVDLIAVLKSCVFEFWMKCDPQVSRQCPRCSRPDQHENFSAGEGRIYERGITLQPKLNIHGRARVLRIFNLRFGERR